MVSLENYQATNAKEGCIMRRKPIAREFHWLCVILLSVSGRMAAQPANHCAQNLFCLFNQEASATGPAGIEKYSHDLIGLIAPPATGKAYIDSLANRLASAEELARAGKGKLVPEANIVRAFNELMNETGAPPSLKTDEATVQRFREHAELIKAFPALFTTGRNGKFCSPGEAVFLLYLLISNDGKLPEQNLDSAVILTQPSLQPNVGGRSVGVFRMEPVPGARSLVSSYPSNHGRKATCALLERLASTLGL